MFKYLNSKQKEGFIYLFALEGLNEALLYGDIEYPKYLKSALNSLAKIFYKAQEYLKNDIKTAKTIQKLLSNNIEGTKTNDRILLAITGALMCKELQERFKTNNKVYYPISYLYGQFKRFLKSINRDVLTDKFIDVLLEAGYNYEQIENYIKECMEVD